MHGHYRKINDRSRNSSTYHKKDGTPVRARLKVEMAHTTVEVTEMPPTTFEVAVDATFRDDMVLAGMHEHAMRQLPGFVG